MLINQQGFTLLETLIAISLSSILLLATSRFFPAMQMSVMREYQHIALQESMWQLAFGIGKHLQRAGYCRGNCHGKGLSLINKGSCVLLQWDENNNGRWEFTTESQDEQIGYRLHDGSLEMRKGVKNCTGKGWEKLSDPEQITLLHFSVTKQKRTARPPLLIIMLSARTNNGTTETFLRHAVVGENL